MPTNEHIITTAAVHETPKIIQKGDNRIKTFSAAQRDEDVARYWKIIDDEPERRKVFPIEYWELEKLFAKSNEVALFVRSIHDPARVWATWKTFDSAKPPKPRKNDYYFVLSRETYTGTIHKLEFSGADHNIQGLKNLQQTGPGTNFLVGLLGLDANGVHTLYMHNASAQLIELDPGDQIGEAPGGEGAGGVKIPM